MKEVFLGEGSKVEVGKVSTGNLVLSLLIKVNLGNVPTFTVHKLVK